MERFHGAEAARRGRGPLAHVGQDAEERGAGERRRAGQGVEQDRAQAVDVRGRGGLLAAVVAAETGMSVKQARGETAEAHVEATVRSIIDDVRVRADDIELHIETAIPCGLILNELISNAYKHGYGPETVRGQIVLVVEDNPTARELAAFVERGR